MLNIRIKEARINKGLSQEELGRKMGGKSKAAVSKWENGDNVPKDLDLLAKVLNVDVNWLRGKKQKSDIDISAPKYANEWDSSMPVGHDEVEVPFYKSIELAAGGGSFGGDDHDGFKLRFGKTFFRRRGVQQDNVICFPIFGDSMSPNIPNGSVVAVDTNNKEIIDGAIYAICQGDLYRLKRLYRMPNNKVRINSFNSVDNPDEVDDLVNINIIGKVFYYSVEI